MRKLYFGTTNLAILAVLAMTFSAGYGASIPKHDHALFGTPPDTAIYCGVKASQQMAVPYTLYVSATAIGSGVPFQIIRKDGTPISIPSVNAGTTYSNSYSLGRVLDQDDVVKIMPVGNIQSMMVSVATGGAAEDPFDETQDHLADGSPAPAQSDNFCVTEPSEPGSASAPALSPRRFSLSGTASSVPSAQSPTMFTDQASTQSLNQSIYCGAVRKVWAWQKAEVFGVRFYVWWYQERPYPYTLTVEAQAATNGGKFGITFRDGDSMGFEVPGGTHRYTHALGGVPRVDDVVKITAERDITSLTARVVVPPLSGFYVWPTDPFPRDPFDERPEGGQAQSNNFCVKTGDVGSTSAAAYFPSP
ncbi:MAG: hypothetical protein HYV04_15405 [Deltaproteobacteria bacterium]|nr:hypothetical protein [Deltaproteobacteria bacterium]